MTESASKKEQDNVQVFSSTVGCNAWVFSPFALVFAFVLVILLIVGKADALQVFFFMLFFIVMVSISFGITAPRMIRKDGKLKLSPDGLETNVYPLYFFVPWNEMIQFKWRNYGDFTGWGILVEERDLQTRDGSYPSNHVMHSRINFIPLSPFVKLPGKVSEGEPVNLEHFKKTPLGQELFYYAPHLFDEEKIKNDRIEAIIARGDPTAPKQEHQVQNPR